MKQYYKVWFSNGTACTAKLVVDTDAYPLKQTSIETYSRLFPYSEAGKMKKFFATSLYDSFVEAFNERAKAQDICLPASDQFYTYDDAGNIASVR